jgi:hypothetical protein
MSDFIEQLGEELEAVVRRRARRRFSFAFAWSPRTFALALLAALAIVAVPAVAVTGVFPGSGSSPPRVPSVDPQNPISVGIGPPCVVKQERKLQTTTAPAPEEVTTLLAVLRRPEQARDILSAEQLHRLAGLPVAGVNPDAIRLARGDHGKRIYIVPAENVRYLPPLPNTEGCKGMTGPAQKAVPGVCVVERGSHGGATCADASGIRSGLAMLTSGGSSHGITRVLGVARDGVRAVVWRVHRGQGFLDTRIPVRNNLYAANVPGRAGHGLYVYFETASGRTLVRGPHHFTKRELTQLRRDKALDKSAGPKPTVDPQEGTTSTIFVFRMRVAPQRRLYVVRWQGPRGTKCATNPARAIGARPALRGPLAGLIRLAWGPPGDDRRWCPGTYTGTIRRNAGGRGARAGKLVGRFSFVVK